MYVCVHAFYWHEEAERQRPRDPWQLLHAELCLLVSVGWHHNQHPATDCSSQPHYTLLAACVVRPLVAVEVSVLWPSCVEKLIEWYALWTALKYFIWQTTVFECHLTVLESQQHTQQQWPTSHQLLLTVADLQTGLACSGE